MAPSSRSHGILPNGTVLSDELDDGLSAISTIRNLKDRIRALDSENKTLKAQNAVAESTPKTLPQPESPTWTTLYRIETSTYIGEPELAEDEHGEPAIKGNLLIKDKNKYFDRHPDICFVLRKDYRGNYRSQQESSRLTDDEMTGAPEPTGQSIKIITVEMLEALKAFKEKAGELAKYFPNFHLEKSIPAPYMFFSDSFLVVDDILTKLSPLHQELIGLFRECVKQNHSEDYRRAREDIKRGLVSKKP